MNRCAILGASGHGKVVAEIAELNGFDSIDFYDDNWPEAQAVEHWSVSGDSSMLLEVASNYAVVVVAIGNNEIRTKKQRQLEKAGARFSVLSHPRAVVSQYADLGVGTVVMANAVINAFAIIGSCCIINTSATVDHDCVLKDGVHISPGANLAGGVCIGGFSWVGIGAQIKPLMSIGSQVVVGAGATVVKHIPNNQVVVGNPAILLDSSKQ